MRALGICGVTLVLILLAGCSSDSSSGSAISPSSPGARTGVASGIVRGERPAASRVSMPPPVQAGVVVTVVAGRAQGASAITDLNGSYALALPEGTFALRWSKTGFQTAESDAQSIEADNTINIPDVVLKTAPWAVTGLVVDSRGNRATGVVVSLNRGDATLPATTLNSTSGADGRYRIASTLPHWETVSISATGTGYEPLFSQQLACCDPPADTTYNFSVVRVLKVTPAGPSTLHVGEGVEMPPSTIDFDNGLQRLVYILPTSGDLSVVAVERGQRGFVLRGVRPGATIITFDFDGIDATLAVQVVEP